MSVNVQMDKDEVCVKLAEIIKTLCEKYNLVPQSLSINKTADYKGGVFWDGTVSLTIGI